METNTVTGIEILANALHEQEDDERKALIQEQLQEKQKDALEYQNALLAQQKEI